MLRKLTKRKAVSPVIATVIIVAVTITVAVAVSYWMSGIASQYTAFEKVEIQTAICSRDPATSDDWVITIKLKNSGTGAATLTNLFINDIEVDVYNVGTAGADEFNATTSMTETETIESGQTRTITVYIDGPTTTDPDQWLYVSPGTTVNIKLHSAGGMDYIRLVRLT